MKKRHITFKLTLGIVIIFLFIDNCVFAQNISWVLYDTPNGDEYHEGLASFYKEGKYGAINTFGQVVISPKFNYSFEFQNGIAQVEDVETGKRGLIDMRGNYITQPIYETIYDFEEGIAKVEKDKKWGLINQRGEIVLPAEYDAIYKRNIYFEIHKGDLRRITDINGKLILPPQYSYISENEDYPILELSKENEKLYFDLNTKKMKEEKYDPYSFQYIGSGIASVRITGRNFYIDANGKEIASNVVNTSDHGVYCYRDSISKKWGFKSSIGKVLIAPTYGYVGEIFINEFMKVSKDNKIGFVNSAGIEVIRPIYSSSKNFNKGFVILTNNEKKGVMNSLGEIIVPFKYKYIEKIKDKVLKVTNDLDEEGIFNLEQRNNILFYDHIQDFSNGYAEVWRKVNGTYLDGIINDKGVEIVPPIYTRVHKFCEGMVLVEKNDVKTILNEKGEVVLQDSPDYDIKSGFSEGVACIWDKKNNKFGYVANPYIPLTNITAIYTQKAFQTMPDEYYTHGNELLNSTDYNGAILYYTKAIELNNGLCDAYINRGVCYYYQGNYPKAIENYSAALSIDPSSTLAKNNLKSAKQSLRSQRWDKAAAILGAIGQGLSTISNATVPNNNGSSSNYTPSSNSSSSVSSQGTNTLQLKRKTCTSCNGTGHIDSEISAYGSLDQKWCPQCNKWVSPTHCHGCKTCPVCMGKGYNESY